MTIIIKNGTLITAAETIKADLLVEGETIKAIGIDLAAPGAEVFDASGCFITPGGVDPHTHFDLPMFDTVSSTVLARTADAPKGEVLHFVFDRSEMFPAPGPWPCRCGRLTRGSRRRSRRGCASRRRG